MSKRIVGTAFTAAVMALSFAAHAIDRDFTVHNNINATVRELYVSPSSSNQWGADVPGADVLAHGAQTAIRFTRNVARGQCVFDIKLVGTDNAQWVVSGINLCTTTAVVFNRSGNRVTHTVH